mgnify:CR=1 FL=1
MSLVELAVNRISYSQSQNGAYALILEEIDGKRKLPIVIGGFEAQSIAIALDKEIQPPRPLTHDLMIALLEKLNVSIEYVLIDSMKNETFYAKLAMKINDKVEFIDSRASDAIALAVRASCPIYANDDVVNNVGVSLDHMAKTAENKSQKYLSKENKIQSGDIDISEFADFIDSLDLDNLGK